ncbi:MAG: beta strand repeat-containing protein, partial [Sphaerospermopsis kisseleviana]
MLKSRYNRLFVLLTLLSQVSVKPANAQITPANDGTNTLVNTTGQQINITGGTQAEQNLYHSFQQFGLNQGQTANFLSNPNIINILGRVTGGDASVINGLIQVTGGNSNLFLMNPAGIIFGNNASLNVPASFTATTANAIGVGSNWFNAVGQNNYNLLTGNPNSFAFLNQNSGAILNTGNLITNQGSVTLLGGTVINTGTISTPNGNITIAATPGEKLVRISQEGSLLSLELPIDRSGLNQATNTPLSLPQLLTWANVNHASGVTVENGQLKLTSINQVVPTETGTNIISGISGNIQANNTINILGDKIGIFNGNISTLGTNGGNIFIGGDYQGRATLPTAQFTYIDPNSNIKAEGINGGNIIVWSEQATRIYGNLSVKGNNQGGLIETSSKGYLDITTVPDISGQIGGTWLIDPTDINIVAGGGNTNINNSSPFSSTGDSSSLGVDLITAALNTGNVTVETGSGGTQAGNISLNANLNYSGATSTLTLNAHGNITISNSINSSVNPLNVTLNADSANTSSGWIRINSSITTNGGNFTANDNVTIANNPTLTGNEITFNGTVNGNSNLTLNGGAGNLTFAQAIGNTTALADIIANSTGTTTFNTVNAATLLTNAGGTTSLNGSITTTGSQTYNDNVTIANNPTLTGNGITFNELVNGNSNLTLSAGTGNLTFEKNVGSTTALNTLTASGNNINIKGNVNTTGLQTYNNAVTLFNNSTFTGNGIIFNNTLTGTGLDFTANAGAGNLTFANNVTLRDIIANSTATTTFNTVTATSLLTNAGGTTSLNGNITTTGSQTYNDNVTIANNPTLAGNEITFNELVDGNSNLTLDAGAGNLTFGNAVNVNSLTTNAAHTNIANNITTAGNQTYNGDVNLTGNNSNQELKSNNGNIEFNGNVAAGNNNVTLTADDIKLPESPTTTTGTGNLTIQPATANRDITLGNEIAGTLNLTITSAEIAGLANGFSSITIGRNDGSGNIAINNPVEFKDPTTIKTPHGNIEINSQITGISNASITLDATTTNLNANITTNNQNISIPKNVILGDDINLNTGASGDILLGGTVNGNHNLTLNAGTGNLTFGNAVNVNSLTTTAANTDIANNITTTGTQEFTGAVNLTGNNPKTFNSTNNDILFSSTINGLTTDFTLNAGAGNLTFGNAVNVNSLTTTAANTNIANNITTAGNQTYNGDVNLTGNNSNQELKSNSGNIEFNGNVAAGNNNVTLTADDIKLPELPTTTTGTGNLTIQSATATRNITLGNEIAGTLNLTSAEIAGLADGFSSITIGRNDGSGN